MSASPPKLFISYSWTSPAHEARVLQLATDLRESRVDVVLDKWDLREEAQIISPELYAKEDQSKFVAVVVERDDEGQPCVPTYYRSRIHRLKRASASSGRAGVAFR